MIYTMFIAHYYDYLRSRSRCSRTDPTAPTACRPTQGTGRADVEEMATAMKAWQMTKNAVTNGRDADDNAFSRRLYSPTARVKTCASQTTP
eukprot:1194615-Prorocentrum_minimum.AAC.2